MNMSFKVGNVLFCSFIIILHSMLRSVHCARHLSIGLFFFNHEKSARDFIIFVVSSH